MILGPVAEKIQLTQLAPKAVYPIHYGNAPDHGGG